MLLLHACLTRTRRLVAGLKILCVGGGRGCRWKTNSRRGGAAKRVGRRHSAGQHLHDVTTHIACRTAGRQADACTRRQPRRRTAVSLPDTDTAQAGATDLPPPGGLARNASERLSLRGLRYTRAPTFALLPIPSIAYANIKTVQRTRCALKPCRLRYCI